VCFFSAWALESKPTSIKNAVRKNALKQNKDDLK
jgi:hypothetical protein